MLKQADNISEYDFGTFLGKLKDRDERSWAQLNFVLKRIIFKWLNRKQIQSDAVTEIYNNTMAVFFEKMPALEFDSFHGLKSYVFSIADNKVKEYYREDARQRRHESLDTRSEYKYVYVMAESDQEDLQERIKRAEKLYDRLAQNEREVMLLVYKEGKSLKEAALIMGLSDVNVRVIKHRALGKMRKWHADKIKNGGT
jgi:RNA polymerase sigma factor (sigma-70 family)